MFHSLAQMPPWRHAGVMKTTAKLFSAFLLGALAACSGMGEAAEVVEAISPAGAYVIDKVAMKEAMMAQMPEEAKAKPEAVAMVTQMIDGMDVSMDLGADGTIELAMKMVMFGQEQASTAKGTWSLEGDKLTMTTTNETGQEETKVARYENGRVLVEEEGQPTMSFVRKK